MTDRKLPIYAGLFANLLIAITKFIVAVISGSAAMTSSAIHSLVDSLNELLMLLGINKSKKPPDEKRPFGYGREIYFWSFIVSVLIFAVGGTISFAEGIYRIRNPKPLVNDFWNYIVLGISFVFVMLSFLLSMRGFNKHRGRAPFWKAVKRSKDPTRFVVLFEDGADLLGLFIAFVGIYLSDLLNAPILDGIASIAIGVILSIISLFMAQESRSLLIGEPDSPAVIDDIERMVKSIGAIERVERPLSIFIGPEEAVVLIEAKFKAGLTTKEIVLAIQTIKDMIRKKYSKFKRIIIEPDGE
jgi:cation diffusion facilitator family transporter